MSELAGLPDFGAPLGGAGFQGYAAYEAAGFSASSTWVLPEALDVAERPDGAPDFALALVRRLPATGADDGYGALDLRLAPRYPLAAALAERRATDPLATVQAALLGAGFARFHPAGAGAPLPPELAAVLPIAWGGALPARWNLRLAVDTAELIRGALAAGTLLAAARIEVEVLGVAPRVPVVVRFDPAVLLPALATLAAETQASPQVPTTALAAGNPASPKTPAPLPVLPPAAAGPSPVADAGPRIARSALLGFFLRPPQDLPLRIEGNLEAGDRQRFAEAMADRVRDRFGAFAPAPETALAAAEPYLVLSLPGSSTPVGGGEIAWDLAQPLAVPRPWVFTLDPFAAASRALRAGVGSVVRQVSVPAFQVGFHEVTVSANLPASRAGALAVGVTLRVPPNPPSRPGAVVQTIDIAPPLDGGVSRLRLGPDEALAYTATPFVVTPTATGVQQIEGPPLERQGEWLPLGPDDFPVRWIGLATTTALAAQADLAGTLTWGPASARNRLPFALSSAQPAVALALPKDAVDPGLEATFQPRGEGRSLHLGPLPAASRTFDLTSFPEYGPHRITVSATFPAGIQEGAALLAIDLLPEGEAESPASLSTLALTAASPSKEWGYAAASPFRAGYRWRPNGGVPPAPWSEPQSPFVPLVLNAEAAMPDPANANQIPNGPTRPGNAPDPTDPNGPSGANGPDAPGTSVPHPEAFSLLGIQLYPDATNPRFLRYLPGNPAPETGPNGRPTLLLVASDRGAILQLGALWGLTDTTRAALRAALADSHPELAHLDLQPAAVSVTGVTLSLASSDGTLHPLATSSSSGMPPFSAVFSAQLDAEQKAQAIAALQGRRGTLLVDYAIALPPSVAAALPGHPPTLLRRADVSSWIPAGELSRHLLLSPATL
jgi:hypothetical protein